MAVNHGARRHVLPGSAAAPIAAAPPTPSTAAVSSAARWPGSRLWPPLRAKRCGGVLHLEEAHSNNCTTLAKKVMQRGQGATPHDASACTHACTRGGVGQSEVGGWVGVD